MEGRCFHKLLGVSYRDHITNDEMKPKIENAIVQGGRGRGRQRKRWEDNIRRWTGLKWNGTERAMSGGSWLQNLQWCPNSQSDNR